MNTVVVIPARYASTRLPGKPLLEIAGKPMIQHVWERATQVRSARRVLIATDDVRVMDAAAAFGAEAVLTREDHLSGTDRLVEVAEKVPADLYLNLQGDEPLVRPDDLEKLILAMETEPAIAVGTLCHALPAAEAGDPNQVKVVLAANGDALYFSRAKIPHARDCAEDAVYWKHVGVYAYRAEVLARYGSLPVSMPELAEKLEQLRLLDAGYRIRAVQVEATGPGVDTPVCLEKVRRLLEPAL